MPYNDSQPRADDGKWSSGGSSSTGSLPPAAAFNASMRLGGGPSGNLRTDAVNGIGIHTRDYAMKLKAEKRVVDFYSRENGDKLEGRVVAVTSDSYTIRTSASKGSVDHTFRFGTEGDPMAVDRAARKAKFQANIRAKKQQNARYIFGSTQI